MNRKNILGLIAIAISIGLVYGMLTSRTEDQFQTRFQEVASYRNPNNTGPVKRIYLVTVSEENHDEMRAYGDLQPHSKYGTTTIYFFPKGTKLPASISPADFPLAPELARTCLSRYRKLAQGQERYEVGPIAEITY